MVPIIITHLLDFPSFLQTVADQLQWMSAIIQKLVLNIIASVEGEDIFYEISVHDLLWGYEDPLLKLLKVLDPKLVPETKFGLFLGVSFYQFFIFLLAFVNFLLAVHIACKVCLNLICFELFWL